VVQVTVVVVAALGAMGFSALLALALGRAAALADRSSEQALSARRSNPTIRGYRQSYAGFADAQLTIARESPRRVVWNVPQQTYSFTAGSRRRAR
jgi:hypothetical protein